MAARFAGLEKIIAKRGTKSAIGFGAEISDGENRNLAELYASLEPDDLLEYGLIPEFVGRLPVVATLQKLDEKALVQILTEPKNALIKQFQRLLEMDDVKLSFTDEAIAAIAKRAIARKTGARGLRSIIEDILLEPMFELPEEDTVAEIVVNEEVVVSSTSPLLIHAEKKARAS